MTDPVVPTPDPVPDPAPTPTPDPQDGDLISALNLNVYRKAIIALIVGAIAWGTQVVNSDESGVTSSEWISGAGYLLAALGVYAVPNLIAGQKAKKAA
jgi:hypothetical protein